MNPIEEINIAKDILTYDLFSHIDLIKADRSRPEAGQTDTEHVELGLLAITASMQLCAPLSRESEGLDWDILIDALEHSVSWIEETAQALPAGHHVAGRLYELSEQVLVLIAAATGAWLWQQAARASQPAADPAEFVRV